MINVLKKIVKIILCNFIYNVEFEGKENIDENKVYVIMSNHVSAMDAIFIWSDIPNIAMMAKEELFKCKLFARMLKSFGAFPIARGKKDFAHVLHAVKIVNKGKKNLLIFPEGTRNAKFKNIKAKNGAVYIAAASEVEVLPVHISEKHKVFGKIKVNYMKPVKLNISKENIRDKKILTQETEKIMNIIYGKE